MHHRWTQTPNYDIAAWRKRIPLLRNIIPMNNCSQSPQFDTSRMAAEDYLESWNRIGMDWEAWMDETDRAKAEFAKLINASPDEIAVSASASSAAASLTSALPLDSTRRKIVSTLAEFPSIGHVWLAHRRFGWEVEWVPVRDGMVHAEDYDPLVDEDTFLVSATHAFYHNGYIQDLPVIAKKAHDKGALLFVDAYQSMGVVPVDVKAMGIDILATGNLKYLLGVPGIAFMYVSQDIVDRFEPAVTGWFGRAEPFSFKIEPLDYHPTAARFDIGTPPVINAYVCRAGMSIINEVGIDNIRAWTMSLSQHLVEGGLERGFKLHGTSDAGKKTPLTAFVTPGDSHLVEELLMRRGIIAASRGPVIRLAPHFYSTHDDVEVALDVLQEVFESPEIA
jgi:selenocysteine lyase/cysteine desulfurase